MFALGVIDCLCIILAYFYTGYWYMIGYEYCMYPYTSYWVGNLNTVVINTCFMLSMLLAFNRFLDMWKPEIGERLFKANRTWIFVFAAVLFGVFGAYYSIPAFFSTDFGTFIYHPLIPGKENLKYYTIFQPIINMFTGVSICLCYSSICIVYWMRLRHGNLQTQTDFQKRILIQAVLICFPTFTVTCMWTSFNFITPTSFLMNVAHLNWQLMHAVPAFVYLFVNKTIRRRAFVMIFACIGVTPGNSYHTNSKVDSTPSKSIELQSPNEDPHQNPRD
ncbi:unnamed protein product, partial [Mesorhabditis belari]|uniref:Uncharacterized protein n=1 Tax=Mesorhabditis belari TaxID=2138241 RepID=A0AAF3J304_9BILA